MKTNLFNLFVYGKTGSGKTLFARRYARDNLIDIPHFGSSRCLGSTCSWSKIYNRIIKPDITPDSIFLWDLFEHTKKATSIRLPKLNALQPNHQHIICSLYPPTYYSKHIQDFLAQNNFIYLNLKDNGNTPYDTVKAHVDDLIHSLL